MLLFNANNQWSTRPQDERFWSLQDAYDQTNSYFESAQEAEVAYADLRVEADEGEMHLVGKAKVPARLSHFAFGQLSERAGCPASFMRRLPATLAAQNINWGLKERASADTDAKKDIASLLFHRNGDLLLRAALSPKYERIWNRDVFNRLMDLSEKGWRVPPARPSRDGDPRTRKATQADVLVHSQRSRIGGMAVKVGDLISPAGIYASDHDMFAFLVNEDRLIDDGRGNALARGAFFWNSEVGAASYGGMTFLYGGVCANHYVWDASGVKEFRIRHVGKAALKVDKVYLELREYADGAASLTEAKIKKAQTVELGGTKEEVLSVLFGLARSKRIPLSERTLGDAYDLAETLTDRYGSPRTAWAMVSGLTELSQQTPFADERAKLDRAAGKLAEFIF